MKKIAIFTGTRAEYGILYWIIKELHERSDTELQLYVGGMHLSPEFGYTIEQIEKDGFTIDEKLEFLLSSDSPVAVSKSIALALMTSAEAIDRNQPDLIVILGDRFESMAVAQAAMISCTPVAHIHGGEITEGLIDDAIRHSITKMSHLHFTANDQYRNRVIQLGEDPSRVFSYGAPGIDSIKKLDLLGKDDLIKSIDFDITDKFFMITYHPVTLDSDGAKNSLINLLSALEDYKDYKLVITYPNADTHGRALIEILDDYKSKNEDRVLLIQSLGQLRYLSLLKLCNAVIGNSSSALIEAPTFNVPTINIGERQKGRITGATVINCSEDKKSIKDSIEKSLSLEFLNICKNANNPYGQGDSSSKIVQKMVDFDLTGIVKKSFYNVEVNS